MGQSLGVSPPTTIMFGTSIWFLATLLFISQQCSGLNVERFENENGGLPSSDLAAAKSFVNQGRPPVVDQLILLLKKLEQVKMKEKRGHLSLHDSLKNLYLKHFARDGRSSPNIYEEDYEDKDDFINYY